MTANDDTKRGRLLRVQPTTPSGEAQLKLESEALKKPKNAKPGWLTPEIAERWNTDPTSFDDGVDVEFEIVKGQPRDIRSPGAAVVRNTKPKPQQRDGGEATAPSASRSDESSDSTRDHEGRFLNPYAFVPWVDRGRLKGDLEPLADRAPAGHHRRHPDLWSGTISIRITATTPLLLLDAEGATRDRDGHRTVPLDLGSDGKPRLAPTALKGALRAAYEAVTASRFGIFDQSEHETRLAYRMEARQGLQTVPARVSDDGIHIEYLPGTTAVGNQGAQGSRSKLHAAWLPAYPASPGEIPHIDGRQVDRRDHGRKLWAVLEPIRKTGRNAVDYWRVRHLASGRESLPAIDSVERSPKGGSHESVPNEPLKVVEGYVLWTDRNVRGKHDERFVFPADDPRPEHRFQLTDELRATWAAVIASYKEAHQGALSRGRNNAAHHDYLGDQPGRTAWSPHQHDQDRQDLRPGQLLYVLIDTSSSGSVKPTGLVPVMIARRVFDKSPWDQLLAPLRPARSLDELSAADRVFGWVHHSGTGAHRGQARILETTCLTPAEQAIRRLDRPGVALAILGSPKPSQGRFYLAKVDRQPGSSKLGGPLQGAKPGQLYRTDTAVRGWKRYWHHADAADEWPEPASEEAARRYDREADVRTNPGRRRKARDDQNSSVLGWVEPGTEFTADIEVSNLDDVELGALLWLFDLPEGANHRIGFGKPLGFGSVRISTDGHSLAKGEGWASYWTDLTAAEDPSDPDVRSCRDRFAGLLDDKALSPVRDAFLALAMGDQQLPVLYPRAKGQEGSQDELFRWFTNNAKGANAALPDPTADDPSLRTN